MTKNEISVKDLVALFGGELHGNDTLRINGFKELVDGSKNSASFLFASEGARKPPSPSQISPGLKKKKEIL